MVEAIQQASCTDCETHGFFERDGASTVGNDVVRYDVECDECGATAAIKITEEGIETSGSIGHEDASWTEDEA